MKLRKTAVRLSSGQMRWLAMMVLISFAALYQRAQAQTSAEKGGATISGTVVSPAGAPLGKASVRLTPATTPNSGALNQGNPRPTLLAITDANGEFSFEGVTPGRYDLSADRTGYLAKTMAHVARTQRDSH